MANEQKQEMSRRRVLGLMGKGTAAAVAVGSVAVAGASVMRDPAAVDLALVEKEFEAGVDAIPFDRLLPEEPSAEQLDAARASLRFRARGIARVILDRGRADADQLMVTKRAMLEAERTVHEVIDGMSAGSLSAEQARRTARTAFTRYFEVVAPLG